MSVALHSATSYLQLTAATSLDNSKQRPGLQLGRSQLLTEAKPLAPKLWMSTLCPRLWQLSGPFRPEGAQLLTLAFPSLDLCLFSLYTFQVLQHLPLKLLPHSGSLQPFSCCSSSYCCFVLPDQPALPVTGTSSKSKTTVETPLVGLILEYQGAEQKMSSEDLNDEENSQKRSMT